MVISVHQLRGCFFGERSINDLLLPKNMIPPKYWPKYELLVPLKFAIRKPRGCMLFLISFEVRLL